ncbi:hypothetical protein BJ878DRAFT_121420 [Calycina marina]|uniref:Uncharacterized protein n=1 Tax=Calycina marina TaxID=1763456 RepID=A0A9P7Z1V4_9HELO|nr:hypothetical protein BJ878DRAFT_121420 [Calycina marina]
MRSPLCQQDSVRSGTSKSSINNPKLLETVEDAIRRLILPELTALKREQSKRDECGQRDRHRRGSVTSGSGLSKDSMDESAMSRRVSEKGSLTDFSNRPKVILNDSEVISGNSIKGRKDKNKVLERVRNEDSPRSRSDREISEETVIQESPGRTRKKRTNDKHRGLEATAVGAGIGALTAAAPHKHSQDSLDEKKERRRRRTKSRSRSDISIDEQGRELVPPMPLMSEINPSEITRSSILSADAERPLSNHSASEQRITPVKEVPRGIASPGSLTSTRTPIALQRGLATQHSNYSRGNLSLHSLPSDQQVHQQDYEIDVHGRKIPMYDDEEYDDSIVEETTPIGHSHSIGAGLAEAAGAAGTGLAAMHQHHNNQEYYDMLEEEKNPFDYYHQEVPPPLKYVPYGQDRRGLSPIPSVSGYTEGDMDLPQRNSRLTRSSGSYSSLGQIAHQHSRRSMQSVESGGANRHDFPVVRQADLTDSELTQDGDYWEEQHRENDRNRDIDEESYRSSDPRVNYKHLTNYTDESTGSTGLDRVAAGQAVRGMGANPDYVHTPVAVESAVASLVNASDLTSASKPYDRRGSYASFEEGSERNFASRGNSPTKRDTFGSPTKNAEYDLDEQGRKVAMPKSPRSTEKAALEGIAAGAAAHYLSDKLTERTKKSSADDIQYEPAREHTGAPLNMSFKDRAKHGNLQIPPSSGPSLLNQVTSREQLKMGASGLPDLHDPMPEIGYGDGESEFGSIVHGQIGGGQESSRDHWPNHPTPPRKPVLSSATRSPSHDANLKAAEAALVGAAVGAGTAAAVHQGNMSSEEEDWARTSGDRKRDTLITNPYEGTSPIAAIGGDRDLLGQPGFGGINHQFSGQKLNYQTATPTGLKDEGYISSAPNAKSPAETNQEYQQKGVKFDPNLMRRESADPFYTPGHNRHTSGMSSGMNSPFYEAATGNNMDRIQSKDIVALMDHLTVRDAQRSARDTEMLVTLVRSAAEMRNSFEDMKRMLADTEDQIINEVQDNTEKSVQKAINGPRPLPPSGPRSVRQGSQEDMYEDLPTKRRNVFRRALKGLSLKSNNDLGKIEDMLVQLLGDVEGLKVAQGLKVGRMENSYDDLGQEGNYEVDHGYDPEGNAGTSTASHASQSGHLSIPHRGTSAARGAMDARKFSDHRISTVPEGDEEELNAREEEVLNNQFENNERMSTPTQDNIRGGSVPAGTPPSHIAPAPLSNENTPRTGADKSKNHKHKSSSSSGWIPKVSRWSETTASTVLRGFRSSGRSSGRKDNDQFVETQSRSGSDLGNYDAEHDPYSEDTLPCSSERQQGQQENEPPLSPLLPPEDPKYKAHRNSLNLQHPQPRPGPTHRYQTALEFQAVDFDAPMSPTSANWSQTSLNHLPAPKTNRYSDDTNHTDHLSPAIDRSYMNQASPPARPPKEPIVPQLPPKIRTGKLQKSSPLNRQINNDGLSEKMPYSPTYEENEPTKAGKRVLSGALGGGPTRKPTGPRSMSSASRSGELNRDEGTVRRHKNRDAFGTIASNHSDSETF